MTRRPFNGGEVTPDPAPPTHIPTDACLRDQDDVFSNLDTIRLGQDFDSEVGVKRLITRVPVRRPDRQEWVRVRPGSDYRVDIAALEFREERDWYLVLAEARPALLSDIAAVRLHLAVNRQAQPFLWPIKLPTDNRRNPWLDSAMDAAAEAERRWVRLVAGRGSYDIFVASSPDIPDPEWPVETFNELLRLAFRERLVDRPDHPVVQRLAGAI
jgi:hypothetical protein